MNKVKPSIVLGIETSCDETAIGIYDTKHGLIGHCLHSQIETHRHYGWVMPEMASRDHIKRITPLINDALAEASITLQDLDAIAYTAGPGLIGSLMVGAAVGRSLAYSLGIPAIPVHHMEGHLLAPMLDNPKPAFPFVSLLISGGHTLLIDVSALGQYQIIGESIDDAVGEAFDKTARLLGLPYPGGPELSQLATKGTTGAYIFPRPMVKHPGLDFSFSGLKTHAMTTWQKSEQSKQAKADIALAFEIAVAQTLAIKCKRALQQTKHTTLVVAGGVSANTRIRTELQILCEKSGGQVFFPRHVFCTDNGAMIAYAGAQHLNQPQADLAIHTQARWPLDTAFSR